MRSEPSLIIISVFVLIWAAAVWDLRQQRIPNALALVGVIIGCTLQLGFGGFGGFLNAFAGLWLGLAILMPGYLMGTTGAGDVKLMAAIGSFLGPYNVLLAGLASIAMGGVVALGFVVSSFFLANSQSPWQRYGLMFKTLFATGRPIYLTPAEGEVMGRKFPFAVSIALGTSLFLIWQSPLLRQIT